MAKAAKKSSGAAASRAPVTSRATGGAGPAPAASGLTGKPPKTAAARHGGAGTANTKAPANVANEALANASTGPVVEHTGGGLAFERQRSGTRAQPTKEQPTTPERAEIVEARRLELEIRKNTPNPASVAAGEIAKVGDRIRVLRAAATGWEMGTITALSEGGGSGAAELDGGEVVGLEVGKWEPAHGALLAPMVDQRDLKENGGLIDRAATDRVAEEQAAVAGKTRSTQRAARPSRAKAATTRSATRATAKGAK